MAKVRVEHVALWVEDLERAREFWGCVALSVGSAEVVDSLTAELVDAGYRCVSDPRTTGDGYYESCILDDEGNRIEITASCQKGFSPL